MTPHHTIRTALLGLAAAGLTLSACGSDAGTEVVAEPETTQPSDTTQPPDTTQPELTEPPLGAGTGGIGSVTVVIENLGEAGSISYEVGCMGDTFPVTPETVGVDGQRACELLGDEGLRAILTDSTEIEACTQIYGGPETARIDGEIDGVTLGVTIDRTDGCGIDSWERLVGLLPPV